jgi:hypothetical protein
MMSSGFDSSLLVADRLSVNCRGAALLRQWLHLAQWALQVLLSLLLDFVIIQLLTATFFWFLLHRWLRGTAGRSRFLPPQLRSRTLQLLGLAQPDGAPTEGTPSETAAAPWHMSTTVLSPIQ